MVGYELTEEVCTYLKDFGAIVNGAVGLYHIDNLTPEAKESGRDLIYEDAKEYVIDDAELQRIYDSYPIIWKDINAKPKLCLCTVRTCLYNSQKIGQIKLKNLNRIWK